MDVGMNMQTAMILDDLPPAVLEEIENNQTDVEKVKAALRSPDVKLDGYFTREKNPAKQIDYTAEVFVTFFKQRAERKAREAA